MSGLIHAACKNILLYVRDGEGRDYQECAQKISANAARRSFEFYESYELIQFIIKLNSSAALYSLSSSMKHVIQVNLYSCYTMLRVCLYFLST